MCVCVCVNVYMCVCVYVCMFGPSPVGNLVEPVPDRGTAIVFTDWSTNINKGQRAVHLCKRGMG